MVELQHVLVRVILLGYGDDNKVRIRRVPAELLFNLGVYGGPHHVAVGVDKGHLFVELAAPLELVDVCHGLVVNDQPPVRRVLVHPDPPGNAE